MRLLKVKLEGFRRFEETDALLVADQLIAIVGPNEAGKTSLLTALDHVDRIDQPLPQRFKTRQSDIEPKISALFELGVSDIEALSNVHDAQDLRRCWVHRTTNGTSWDLERRPNRDTNHRLAIVDWLQALSSDRAALALLSDPDEPEFADDFATAQELASSPANTLSTDLLPALDRLANAIERLDIGDPDIDEEEMSDAEVASRNAAVQERQRLIEDLAEALRGMAAAEAEPAPSRQAVAVLQRRLPVFVTFDADDRELSSEYDLSDFDPDEAGNSEGHPVALENIADLANLDLARLRQAMAGDPGTVMLLMNQANDTLRQFFDENYGQSDVSLLLDTDGTVLRLLSLAESGEDVIELSEKSDGFKWFVGLVAFLARRKHERPIVLIDEIETHLHYAAQADVIDILINQHTAPQVIYTTHSAGALPPDLGRGVRAVEQVPKRQRSRINNSFWTSGPGTSPLLFGLGASTLALSIPKFLLIVEGPSDAILLPSLIREATGIDELPYRIAPGIASTSPADFHSLDTEGGRVVYLVDGDVEGASYEEELAAALIGSDRILNFGTFTESVVSPEDLIEPAVYLRALNAEGRPFWDGEMIGEGDLPAIGRAKAAETWCKDAGLPLVSKVRVAQNVIERTWDWLRESNDEDATGGSTPQLCSETGQASLLKLHELVTAAMNLQ